LSLALVGELIGFLGIAGTIAWWRFLYSARPALPGLAPLTSGQLVFPTGARTYHAFVPADCPKNAALVLVLHGSRGDADHIRRFTGYEFERLADQHKFVVVYPEGFGGYWNDARRLGSFPAKRLHVDDVGFLSALVEHFRNSCGIGGVFGVGYSNGGHMCIRMALEAPQCVDGIAVVAASMPTDDNLVCPPAARPTAALFVNGTRDPINPYAGGRVTIFGFGDRGRVRSAVESAEYFARQLGTDVTRAGPEVVLAANSECPTWLEQRSWCAPLGREVVLFTVHGGGHVVPQPNYRFPRLLGRTEMRFNAPAACWAFFSRVMMARAA
jgi:polyhydroxybutyrate depolymerase